MNEHPLATTTYLGLVEAVTVAVKEREPAFDLALGIPRQPVTEELKSSAIKAIMEDHNSYCAPEGLHPLREMIFQSYGKEIKTTSLPIVTSGTSAAITIAILAVAQPGDDIVLLEPYFIQHRLVVEQLGMRAIMVPCDESFVFLPDVLRQSITPRTRAILFSTPSNPTGTIYSESQLGILAQLAVEAGVYLISDEIYGHMVYDDRCHAAPSLITMKGDHFVATGFSKSHSIAGWRVGCLFAPGKFINRLVLLHHTFFACAPTPFQYALADGSPLRNRSSLKQLVKNNRIATAVLSKAGFTIQAPKAGYFAFPRLPDDWADMSFFEHALAKGVAVLPGCLFSSSRSHIRISLVGDDDKFEQAIRILSDMS